MCPACLARRAVLAAIPTLGMTRADAPIEPRLRLPGPAIALTLDACPGGFDPRIAELLIARRIPATIFATGLWLRNNAAPLALLRAHPDLFVLENHGARHLPPVLGTARIFGLPVAGTRAAIAAEIAEGAAAITQATGRRPAWYRAATGFYSPDVLPDIRAQGFAIAGYSLNADQGASLPAATVAARIARAAPGEVIVAHINQPHRDSGQGVAHGIQALHAAGAVFARLPPTS